MGPSCPERSKRGDDAGVERVDVARPHRPRAAAGPIALRRDQRPLLRGAPLERLRVTERMPAHAVKEHHARRTLRRAAHHERRRRSIRLEGLHPDRPLARAEGEQGESEHRDRRTASACSHLNSLARVLAIGSRVATEAPMSPPMPSASAS